MIINNITIVNRLLIIYVICLILWMFYNFFIRQRYEDPLNDDPLSSFKYSIDIDGWNISHLVLYFIIGLFIPNAHIYIIIISILWEIVEYILTWRAKWILDPVVNLFGYFLGTLVGPIPFPNINYINNIKTTLVLTIILIIGGALNHPNNIAKKSEALGA